jgi:hypothetical protein
MRGAMNALRYAFAFTANQVIAVTCGLDVQNEAIRRCYLDNSLKLAHICKDADKSCALYVKVQSLGI